MEETFVVLFSLSYHLTVIELFVTLVRGLQPLTNATKSSILDVAVVLDTPLLNRS